jgi:hypothetical protein
MIEQNQADRLAARVSRAAAPIEGSRPFWSSKRKDLTAQIRDIGCPSVFFSCSAADIQWPDLHQHMPDYDETTAHDANTYRTRWKNLNENPGKYILLTYKAQFNHCVALAAYYFQKRWEVYFECFMKVKFKIKDYWWRYEWQHRGSSHIHGFLWLEDAPDIEKLDLTKAEDVEGFIDFWDPIVSTMNPAHTCPPAEVHPSAQLFNDLKDTKRELAQLLNRFQRHTKCSRGYCLRKDKHTGQPVCRFHFPKDLRAETCISTATAQTHKELNTRRNDALLNSHNIPMILGWRANLDFRPVLHKNAVIAYVAKYASKAETQSTTLTDMLKKSVRSLNDHVPAQVAFQKMLSAFAGERDMSAQETCHILLDCPMVRSSRIVRNLNVSQHEEQEIDFESNTVKKTGVRHRYRVRLDGTTLTAEQRMELEGTPLIEFARHWTWDKGVVKKRGGRGALPFALNIWPRFECDPENEESYENWCYARMILHHAFKKEEELLGNHPSWTTAYDLDCVQAGHTHVGDTLPEGEDDDEEDLDSDTESLPPEEDDDPDMARYQEQWMRELGRRPGDASVDDLDTQLGKRPIDVTFNWHDHSAPLDVIKEAAAWLPDQIKQFPNDEMQELAEEDYSKLKGQQQQLFLQVMAYMKALKSGQSPEPLRINVDGTAGTGKSVVIRAITSALRAMYAEELGNEHEPVVRMAPTGIAAFGIKGWTINFGLGIRVAPDTMFKDLGPGALARLQSRWASAKLLILDEKSMVGQSMLW